jgi:hypothetical protein
MNVETVTEAVQFPEKEYRNRIFVAVDGNQVPVGLHSTYIYVCSATRRRFLTAGSQYFCLSTFPTACPCASSAKFQRFLKAGSQSTFLSTLSYSLSFCEFPSASQESIFVFPPLLQPVEVCV